MINSKTLERKAVAGLDFGLNWYGRAQDSLKELATTLDYDWKDFALLCSSYSPQVAVFRSIKFAAYHVVNNERPPGSMNMSYVASNRGLGNGKLNGPKTEAFRRCLIGDLDALVLDTWICKAIDVEAKFVYQKRYFPAIRRRFESAADRLGISIADCQAAVWVATMREHGRADVELIDNRVDEILSYAGLVVDQSEYSAKQLEPVDYSQMGF